MTRKSKVQQKADMQANGDSPTAEEFESIKQQNLNFAKEIHQYKVALTEAIDERDQARRELLGERAFSGKILRYVGDIQKTAKANMNILLSSSNNTSEILNITNVIHHLANKEKTIHSESAITTNSPSKTQVVNPMIAGHVILRPIINLQRVNEISSEEIRRLSNPHLQMNNSNLVDNYSNTNEEPSSPTNSNQSPRNGVIRHGGGGDNQILEFKFEGEPRHSLDNEFQQNNSLGTIVEGSQEPSELASNILELSRPGCSRQPLLSGVFHDVRMYVSSVPEMLDNINTQRGSNTKSLKLTKSPNMTSKSSNKLSSRNKSCVESNVLEGNFDLSSDNFNLQTPILSSTRLNASNLMTEPRPSTSFRSDDLSDALVDNTETEQQFRVKRVTFDKGNMVTRRGKRVNVSNSSVQNIETVLQSPDSCTVIIGNQSNLNTTSTTLNNLQTLESLPNTPTSSKIDTPLSNEMSHLRMSTRKTVVNSTEENKTDIVPRNKKKAKGKKMLNNKVTVPINRITRSKYRKPIKHVDSIYTARKSDHSRKSGSLELINENSETTKSQTNASDNQSNMSNNHQPSMSKNQSIVSNNLTNNGKSENLSKSSLQSTIDTNASGKKKRSTKRKVQEAPSENLVISPKKRRGARVEISLKEPNLRIKMRR